MVECWAVDVETGTKRIQKSLCTVTVCTVWKIVVATRPTKYSREIGYIRHLYFFLAIEFGTPGKKRKGTRKDIKLKHLPTSK